MGSMARRTCANDTVTITKKRIIDSMVVGRRIRIDRRGNTLAQIIPKMMGMPRMMPMEKSISLNGISKAGRWLCAAVYLPYSEPQNQKLKGVMMGAKSVVRAVIDTDNSTLPFESDDMKLDMLPPGHDATKIIPMATIGVIKGLSIMVTRKVTAGSATHCIKIPTSADLGFLIISLNEFSRMPRATPNIINARITFTTCILPCVRATCRPSIFCKSSFIRVLLFAHLGVCAELALV